MMIFKGVKNPDADFPELEAPLLIDSGDMYGSVAATHALESKKEQKAT